MSVRTDQTNAPRPIRSAIVGAGQIARQHLTCLRDLGDVDVVGVCDLSRAMAECAAHQFEVPRSFTDFDDMLDQTRPDVIHVATPPQSHYSLAKKTLEFGCHTVIEKPATEHLWQLEELIEIAEASKRIVIEDHNYLFNDSIQQLLRLIASGDFGQVVHVEVNFFLDIASEGSAFADPNLRHPVLSLPGGAITDFLPHLAYLAIAFVGHHKRTRVHWQKRSPGSPLPFDEMRGIVECEHGTAALNFSSASQPDAFFVRVHGTKMRAEAHLFEPRVLIEKVRAGGGPLMPIVNGLALGYQAGTSAFASLTRKLSGGPGAYEGLYELLRRTYYCVATEGPPPVSVAQIRDTAMLVNSLTAECEPCEC